LNVVVTAINCAAADYVQYAKIANYQSFAAMPAGKYHPRYLKDQEDIIIDQEPQKEAASN
jgi:hypothetical protein